MPLAIRAWFRAAGLVGLWIPAFAGMTEWVDWEKGFAARDSGLVSGSRLGWSLDSRFRGNDGVGGLGEGICRSRFGLGFGYPAWLVSGFPLSRE